MHIHIYKCVRIHFTYTWMKQKTVEEEEIFPKQDWKLVFDFIRVLFAGTSFVTFYSCGKTTMHNVLPNKITCTSDVCDRLSPDTARAYCRENVTSNSYDHIFFPLLFSKRRTTSVVYFFLKGYRKLDLKPSRTTGTKECRWSITRDAKKNANQFLF